MFAQFLFKQKQEPIYVVFDKSDECKKFLNLLIMNTKLLKRNQKFKH